MEIMDDLTCHGKVVDQTLRELDVINHWLGGNAATLNGLKKLLHKVDPKKTTSIVDLGCGSGEMLKLIAKQAKKEGRLVAHVGIDANPSIVAFAKEHSTAHGNIEFEAQNIFSKEFQERKFDVVLTTLFLHHFDSEQLIALFKQLKTQAEIGIVVNDLHRHPLAYYSIKLLTRFFSRSSMVQYDAPLSVLRAFKKQELITILKQAGIHNYTLKWKWAFRWQIIINS
ncbi:MAG: methyltransferase domain-containing protein [Bacteroidia bacterium]|nr:methyltransferase domain-containing protein [Bacteroidia bacterium]